MDRITARILGDLQDRLPMFVIYDHPVDFPEEYVARLWVTLPEPIATTLHMCHAELSVLRDHMQSLGLVRLTRNQEDDPCIVETWM